MGPLSRIGLGIWLLTAMGLGGCSFFVGTDRVACTEDDDCPASSHCDLPTNQCRPDVELADGGSGVPVDGGVPAADSGPSADAGPLPDAGPSLDSGPGPDGGMAGDGGLPADSGNAPDSGSSSGIEDAGTTTPDASTAPEPDAGFPSDAGAPPDSGLQLDAGSGVDAGSALDAGPPPDSGAPPDAGPPMDAGALMDGGGAQPESGNPGADGGAFPATLSINVSGHDGTLGLRVELFDGDCANSTLSVDELLPITNEQYFFMVTVPEASTYCLRVTGHPTNAPQYCSFNESGHTELEGVAESGLNASHDVACVAGTQIQLSSLNRTAQSLDIQMQERATKQVKNLTLPTHANTQIVGTGLMVPADGYYDVEVASTEGPDQACWTVGAWGKLSGSQGSSISVDAYCADRIQITQTTDEADSTPGDGCPGGNCSLRSAFMDNVNAMGPLYFELAQGTHDLSLTGSEVNDGTEPSWRDVDLTFTGNDVHVLLVGGGSLATIKTDLNQRLMQVHKIGSLRMQNITLKDGGSNAISGSDYSGCAVDVRAGRVQLFDVTVTNNTCHADGTALRAGPSGWLGLVRTHVHQNKISSVETVWGTVFNEGELFIRDSLINDNTISDSDGMADNGFGGGVYVKGTTTIWNTTIADNHADGQGGGIYVESGDVVLLHVTLSDNTDGQQSGNLFLLDTPAVVEIGNSILQQPTAPDNNCRLLYGGSLISWGDNTYHPADTGCDALNATGDASHGTVAANPNLTNSASVDGVLLPQSPGIDSADNARCIPWDQRLYRRPHDYPGYQNGAALPCDRGAAEHSAAPSFP
jgi:hypothetical protein